jgi:hypothetical protein
MMTMPRGTEAKPAGWSRPFDETIPPRGDVRLLPAVRRRCELEPFVGNPEPRFVAGEQVTAGG